MVQQNSCQSGHKIFSLINTHNKCEVESVETTNKMKPCNRIYYSKIYWRLNMFRAAYRSSSGALDCICSLWFIYSCDDRPLSRLGGNSFHPAWTTAGHHMSIQTRGCKYSLEHLMMSGMPLETCWVFNKFWNNKFYYKVASCWLFLLIHTRMHGSMNIKKKCEVFYGNRDECQQYQFLLYSSTQSLPPPPTNKCYDTTRITSATTQSCYH